VIVIFDILLSALSQTNTREQIHYNDDFFSAVNRQILTMSNFLPRTSLIDSQEKMVRRW